MLERSTHVIHTGAAGEVEAPRPIWYTGEVFENARDGAYQLTGLTAKQWARAALATANAALERQERAALEVWTKAKTKQSQLEAEQALAEAAAAAGPSSSAPRRRGVRRSSVVVPHRALLSRPDSMMSLDAARTNPNFCADREIARMMQRAVDKIAAQEDAVTKDLRRSIPKWSPVPEEARTISDLDILKVRDCVCGGWGSSFAASS